MGICLGGACAAGCPEWIMTLAGIGGIVIYVLLGALIFAIVKSFKDDIELEWILLFIVFWPLIIAGAIIGAVVYYVVRLITMPIVGVDKMDLKDFEKKIDNKLASEDTKIRECLKEKEEPKKANKVKLDKKGKKRKK